MRTLFAPTPLCAGELLLEDAEAHHGRTVLRLKAGDRCRLVDGQGAAAEASVLICDRHQLRLAVTQPDLFQPPPSHHLTVAMAAPKGSRLDDVTRALVEIGVGQITLINSERASRMPQLDRLERIAREALKQCRGHFLPRLSMVDDFLTWRPSGRLVMLDPRGGAVAMGPIQPTTLVIGPEGGLTAAEEKHLLDHGAQAMRLLGTILRIETAAIAAAAVMTYAWEDHD